MANALVDEEMLEDLTFKRSKRWASHLKEIDAMDDGAELDLREFDELFKNESEDPEAEEAEEAPKEDEKLDMSNFHTTTTVNMSTAELTLMLCGGEDKEAKAELEEILNQTMPVVQEHRRKWKEAGLDRILDTFDEQQIEEHVGQWMRHNNSVYLQEAGPPPKFHRHPRWSDPDPSDSESLHSVDTARYIRQSRRCNVALSNKFSSNLTTIKMYRKHSHKRDELRAKYGYEDEQEHRHHMQALLHRRREKERQLAYMAASPRHCHLAAGGHHPRRKHLRKRRADSTLFDSFSSEDEERCECRSCRRHLALSRSAYQCCPYSREDYRQAASRSLHHLHHHRPLHRSHNYDIGVDLRPRLRENECSCCNSDRLCTNVVHIANSSTEEWVVENCNSPAEQDLQHLQTPRSCKKQLITLAKTTSQSARLNKVKVSSACRFGMPTLELPKSLDSNSFDGKELLDRKRLVKSSLKKMQVPVATPRGALKLTENSASTSKKAPKKTTQSRHLSQIMEEGLSSPSANPEKSIPPKVNQDLVVNQSESSEESEGYLKGKKRLVSFSEATSCARADSKLKSAIKTPKPVESSLKKATAKTRPLQLPEQNKIEKQEPIKNKPTREKIQNQMEKKAKGRPRNNLATEKAISNSEPNDKTKPVARKTKPLMAKKKASKLPKISEETANSTPDSQTKKAKEPKDSEASDDDDLYKVLALSKETFKKEQQMRQLKPSSEEMKNQPEATHSISQSLAIFNNHSVACNSTALANDTASTRVLPKREELNRTAPVSSSAEPEIIILNSSSENEERPAPREADCTAVTSTTAEPKPPPIQFTKRGILLHRSSSEVGSGDYTLTEQGLGRIIGERWARRYLKYHMGSRSFDSRHSVYYQPTPELAVALGAPEDTPTLSTNLELNSSSSSSDEDVFDNIQRYGLVYSVLEEND
ncbi:hypothetical protein KR009_009528 [Drosophila setifemur]|nr:hypothetical protein KR009_009528 [Drosophila setifemur]